MHITCESLSKTFGSRQVVKDISLDIRPGKILALLGPNGAGKSTTIKMLTGNLKPSSGSISIGDQTHPHLPQNYKSQIGIMPQEIIVWDDLTIKENLEYTATNYFIPKGAAKERIGTLIEDLKLQPELNTLARNLSGGYKRRLNLAISILHDPEVVFLDEPTPGIDAQSRILLTEYIQKLVSDGKKAVVLTDHYLEEAEKLADYVVIIDNGEIITQGTVSELKAKHGSGNLLQIHLDPSADTAIDSTVAIFQKDFDNVTLNKDTINIGVSDVGSNLNQALDIIKSKSIQILNINIKEPSLEDIFLLITGKSVRE